MTFTHPKNRSTNNESNPGIVLPTSKLLLDLPDYPRISASSESVKQPQAAQEVSQYDSEIIVQVPEDWCIHQWFESQVQKAPDRVAIIGLRESLTYQELNERANQLAHYLKFLGVGADEIVAVCAERSPEMVVAFLGVLKAGGAYLPLDPTYPHARRAYKLKDSRARVILTQHHLTSSLPELTGQKVICLDADWGTIAQFGCENLSPQVTPDNLAYVIYTSGSTGNPKGVLIPHRGVVNHSAAMSAVYELQPSDRVLQFSSMSFDIIVEELYPSLVSGATLVLRTEDSAASTKQFLNFIQQHQITVLNLPTAFWHEWVNGMALLEESIPGCVRLVIVGGEKASRSAYVQWMQLGDHHPRWLNGYGPTEATVTTTVYDPAQSPFDSEVLTIPIGKPIPNAKVYILDEALQPVPPGMPGELHIGGPGLARGYLNLEDKTALKFIPDPFSQAPNSRLYKTGDMVRYLPDGNIEFIGRTDFQVKIRGFRIELSEIEVCLEQHEAVQQAIALAHESDAGEKYLVAYWIAKPEQSASTALLHQFLLERLPHYMVPAVFVQLESFPLTPNGKVDRQALPVPQADSGASDRAKKITLPRTKIERQLVQIWETILNLQPIGIQDNFFELGGHSLLVARLFDQIESQFSCSLPLTVIFDAPTVEQLAQHIASAPQIAPQIRDNPAVVPLKTGTLNPPLFLIIAFAEDTELYLNLAQAFEGDRPIYGLRAHDAENRLIPFTTIADVASYLIQQMQQVQPEGPYLLGGQCGGGNVAFEMAQQLQKKGETVALLALMDAADVEAVPLKTAMQTAMDNLQTKLKQIKNQYLLPLVHRYLDHQLPFSQAVSKLLPPVRVLEYYRDRQQPLPPSVQPVEPAALFDFAFEQHKPQGIFTGHFVFLRATEGNGETNDEPYINLYQDPLLGWGQRIRGEIKIYDVPGGHGTMLASAHASTSAKILQAAVRSALAEVPHSECVPG